MSKTTLRPEYLSSFCLELHLILQAGIPLGEGIGILLEDEKDKAIRPIFQAIFDEMETGATLHTALQNSGYFPHYMITLIQIGENTGKLDSVLEALAGYYDRQDQINRGIRRAVVYPSIILVMMLLVVLILITQVLPVFSNIFQQLGSTMSGLSTAILNFGTFLNNNWLLLTILLVVVIGLIVFLVKNRRTRQAIIEGWLFRSLSLRIATARFAAAMAMTMQSGLDVDASLEMAEKLVDNKLLSQKIAHCKKLMQEEDQTFASAVNQAGIFSGIYSRMLTVGFKTGSADRVMDEIARRSEEESQNSMESLIGKVEPTLVIVMSVIMGLILLAVMLPLMGVMSSLG